MCTFQGNIVEAEVLYERSTAIWAKALGPNHPIVATVLNNYAELLASIVRARAEEFEGNLDSRVAHQRWYETVNISTVLGSMYA